MLNNKTSWIVKFTFVKKWRYLALGSNLLKGVEFDTF